jgi:hypothetical protein
MVRALRVGVLLGDNLVEERVFPGATPITFGQSLRCTLSIPADGVPLEHVLFARDQGRLLLRLTAKMDGRISQGGTIRTELRDGTADNGVWTIPIARGARGKLRIGDATVLFQEIAAPPIAPRPRLPASIRGTLADRIDRRLAVIIGGSLLAHLGIAGWAWIDDIDTSSASLLGPKVAQQYRQETMEVTLPEIVDSPSTEPGTGTPVSPVQTPAPIVPRPQLHTGTPVPGRTFSDDDATRMAQILTGSDPGRTGPGEMHSRQPGADLDKQLADLRDGNRRITIGDDGHTFRDRPGTPRIGTHVGPIAGDPNQLTALPEHRPDNEPGGRIVIKPLPGDGPGTTLTVDAVLAKINGVYMSGLQRCYKKGLLGDSTLSGKVAMSFTVTDTGRLEDATAHGVSADVDACISALMTGWRFPIPKDKDGDTTDASFKLGLALQPS